MKGLILVCEPYYNEAGYEKQKGTKQGAENSRMYNEMVLIKLVQSMTKQFVSPPAPWSVEIKQHIRQHGPRFESHTIRIFTVIVQITLNL